MWSILLKIKTKVKYVLYKYYKIFKVYRRSENKIFVIGLNKTGTTSMEKVFKDFKYIVDNQNEAHKLMYFYEKRDFISIARYCKRSEVFQDSPFSLRYLFFYLHQAYPDAKFILTIRNSPEEWYSSLVNFHKKLFSSSNNMPSKKDLKNAARPYGRTVYDNLKMRFNTPDDDLYNEDTLISYYQDHNNEVIDYFRLDSKKFLLLNLKELNAYQKLCKFLGKKPLYEEFPWENKT